MELKLSNADAAFRDEVRSFITDNYPVEMRVPNPETDLTKEQSLLWHRILYRKGWVAPLWPKEYGGPGWTITQRYIFEQETSRAGTLPPLPFGITMVGPVIYTFGNEAQKKKFLPRILRRRLVVPGLLGAERRVRPCLIAHESRTRRRPLRGQWAQDMDHARAACRLDILSGS